MDSVGKVSGRPSVELTPIPARTTPLEKVYAFWFAGMSCDGCSISVTGASEPSVEDLLLGRIPGLPRVVLYHPVLSSEAGEDFIHNFELAAQGKLDAPYVIILEGSAVDDTLIPGEGYWVGLGARKDPDGNGSKVISVMEWIDRMAPGAAASIAIGTCATWGGIPAAAGNPTGAMGLMDYLGADYRSAFGLPVINIPGCAPVGDNFTEVIALVLQFLQGNGPLPEFDELGRPAWQFRDTVHDRCVRGGYYEEGKFAQKYGDPECLVDVGCWGPVVKCNIVERGALRHHGGCMSTGGICIGCTMPGFPDKFTPFYVAPPGSAISEATSQTVGGMIRFLRSFTQHAADSETRWDRVGAIPSGWAPQRRPEPIYERLIHFLYKKQQHMHSVVPGRGQEVTKFRDGYEVDNVTRKLSDADQRKSGRLRRSEKLQHDAAAGRI